MPSSEEPPLRRLNVAPIIPLLVLACGGPAATSPTASPPAASTVTTTEAPLVNAASIVATIATAGGPIELAATDDAVWVENHRANFVSRIDPAQNLEVAQLTD